ncbi:MAG: Holliday junction branch migration protein RuvA, partial [Acidimicrobiales bacterium]
MIGSLRGTVLEMGPGGLLVEVGGVGYRVAVPSSEMALHQPGAPVFLHVHTHVREDALVLYGFAEREAKVAFEALLGAHGVGPSLALAILSVHSAVSLRRAVSSGDVDALTLVPGVGRKTAARLLLELATRLHEPDGDPAGLVALGAEGPGAVGEVRAALAGLGYAPEEIREAVRG